MCRTNIFFYYLTLFLTIYTQDYLHVDKVYMQLTVFLAYKMTPPPTLSDLKRKITQI